MRTAKGNSVFRLSGVRFFLSETGLYSLVGKSVTGNESHFIKLNRRIHIQIIFLQDLKATMLGKFQKCLGDVALQSPGNINQHGRVCHSILGRNWTRDTSMQVWRFRNTKLLFVCFLIYPPFRFCQKVCEQNIVLAKGLALLTLCR